jgi:bifunctional non-homologous end joining protein LigD
VAAAIWLNPWGLQTARRLGHIPRSSLPSSAQFVMLLPNGSRLKSSFVPPCLPSRSAAPPSGPGWIHEIKHDGFRIMARRDARGVRLFSRNSYNFGDRFPLIVKAIEALPVRSCSIDGEAIVVDSTGLSVFDLLRYRQHDGAAVPCAFDRIELDGKDLRNAPIEQRKDLLGKLLRAVQRSHCGITLNQHYEGDGAIIYKHACRFGCEGIVSKRLSSPYRSGRVDDWLKIKNPAAPAVKREAEEDWGAKRWARGRRT